MGLRVSMSFFVLLALIGAPIHLSATAPTQPIVMELELRNEQLSQTSLDVHLTYDRQLLITRYGGAGELKLEFILTTGVTSVRPTLDPQANHISASSPTLPADAKSARGVVALKTKDDHGEEILIAERRIYILKQENRFQLVTYREFEARMVQLSPLTRKNSDNNDGPQPRTPRTIPGRKACGNGIHCMFN